jgi:hypothetical protein
MTEFVGPLDYRNRAPGVYVALDGTDYMFTPFKVLFDGDNAPCSVKACHLAIIGGFEIPSDEGDMLPHDGFVRKLPKPLAFYPGDSVSLAGDLFKMPRKLISVSFTDDGTPMYSVGHTTEEQLSIKKAEREQDIRDVGKFIRMASQLDFPAMKLTEADLVLLARGNIYILYEGRPDDLVFDSLEAEALFWAQHDVSYVPSFGERCVVGVASLAQAIEAVVDGKAEAISFSGHTIRPMSYDARVLRPLFSAFRKRSKNASLEYWQAQEDQTKKQA